MKKVKSSHIAGINYDDSTKVLTVNFQSGHVYTYSGVPQSVITLFNLAESKGKYFDKYIRGKYMHRKLK